MNPVKGSCGYIRRKKIVLTCILIVVILISVGLFLCGYLATKTSKNILTVVAFLGVLPMAKALVSLILFLPHKSLPEDDFRQLSDAAGSTGTLYADMIFTPCGRVLHLDAMYASRTEAACLLLAPNAKKEQQIVDDLTESMKKRGENIHVHIFHETSELAARIQSISEKDEPASEQFLEFLRMILV